MSVSVQEIVNLPIFNTAKVLSGIEYLNERQVEWVSAIEGPVENFVRKGELVVTTGMGADGGFDVLFDFVQDVYESDASALGIAIGRYIFEIPEEIIAFAQEKKFVLIELPWELRFADIQRRTMEEINRRQQRVFEKARQMQKTLMDYVIVGKELTEIIKLVERELDGEIVFSDSKGRIKATRKNASQLLELWKSLEEDGKAKIDQSAFRHLKMMAYNDGFLMKKEITSGPHHQVQGFFIILIHNQISLNPVTFQILESLTAATALWISKEDAIVQTELRLRNEFIWGLAKTRQMTSDQNIHARAKLFGYQLSVPYICIVGYSENLETLSHLASGDIDYNVKNIMYYIEEEVRYAASIVGKKVAFTLDKDLLIIYLETKLEENSTVHHFLDLVDKRLHALIPGVIFSWGIGMHKSGIMEFHESFKKAQVALDMSMKQKGAGERVSFDDTQLNRLLLHLANDIEVQEITLSTIKPLIDYEEKREIDLIQTFIAYDNQNGNVSQAARILNLHRQSLLYRLRKIESLTHLSLDNPDDVFLLNISIKVWQTGMIRTINE